MAGAYRRFDDAGREALLDFLSGLFHEPFLKSETTDSRWPTVPVPDDLLVALFYLDASEAV
jgi:hypothetical protein